MAQTNDISGGPVYPGRVLQIGSSGSEVARMQTYLNALQKAGYPTLKTLTVDGRYGSGTDNTVKQFQAQKGLSIDGKIGPSTWNAIVSAYNAVYNGSADTWPGIALRPGSAGQDVRHMQLRLNQVSTLYPGINKQTEDGKYGQNMTDAVRRFQTQFGLAADGILGKNTWNALVSVQNAEGTANPTQVTTPYSGTAMRTGSSGDYVRFLQSYLNALGAKLTVDGQFGTATNRATQQFQAKMGLPIDGVVGSATWAKLIPAFNNTL